MANKRVNVTTGLLGYKKWERFADAIDRAVKTREAETRPPDQPKAAIIAYEAAQLALLLGEFAGLEKSLTAQLAVNATTRVNPLLKSAADELKTAIASMKLHQRQSPEPSQHF
ncbi:hypothetical protein [Nostoc sp. CALU 1950]|uniref:hypothetical protein n=1 Tax=Nostoc sp. CALU 1950 TaxID=3104321 RepID=UPI003EBC7244